MFLKATGCIISLVGDVVSKSPPATQQQWARKSLFGTQTCLFLSTPTTTGAVLQTWNLRYGSHPLAATTRWKSSHSTRLFGGSLSESEWKSRLDEFEELLHEAYLDTHREAFYERDFEDFYLSVRSCEHDLREIVETWQRLMDSIEDPTMKERVSGEYGPTVERLKEEFENELNGFQAASGYRLDRSIGAFDPLSASEIEELLNELPDLINDAYGHFYESVATKRNRNAASFVGFARETVKETVDAFEKLMDDIEDPDEKSRVRGEYGPKVEEMKESLASLLENLPGNKPREE
jgi:hypothetical protein